MANAVRGTGEIDARTKDLIRQAKEARMALSRHFSTAETRRNTSKKIAAAVLKERQDSGVALSRLAGVMEDIIEVREAQATAVPGKTPAGKPRRVVRRK